MNGEKLDLKRDILELIKNRIYAGEADIFKNITGRRTDVKRMLISLEKEHDIVRTKQGRYALGSTAGYFKGVLEVKQNGYGFLRTGSEIGDIFIPKNGIGGAMDGDEVLVRFKKTQQPGKNLEGKILKILSPTEVLVVGEAKVSRKSVCVVPDNRAMQQVSVAKDDALGAKDGDKVLLKIVRRAEGRRGAEGKIIEVLGKAGDKGVDILMCARRFGLDAKFDKKVTAEANKLKREQMTLEGREDFRSALIFTIDGADSKDLDDAVSLVVKRTTGEYELGVHIADVSHYVRENSALDGEALLRGTSAYLVNEVVPMLPKVLSDDLCSLNPGEDKYTLSCIMRIDKAGRVLSHRVVKGIINTRCRLTYEGVNKLFAGDKEAARELKEVAPTLRRMNKLAAILRKKRFAMGSIDFDLDEAKITLDKKGKPVDVSVRERGDAEKLIEEFMLACNVTVAERMHNKGIPFLYRTHEQPDTDKMKELAIFLKNFGIKLKNFEDIKPKAVQEVLAKVEGEPYAGLINSITLRSLKKARYDTEPIGHFGLAAEQYCHFTSPIRRYPDLMAHRIIKEGLDGLMTKKRIHYLEEILPEVAKKTSERERNAIEAERAIDDIKMAEYMSTRIGEEFEGVVSGVTNFGVFVELENMIEGMVPLSSLDDDYYEYNEKQYCVIGKRRGNKITLGDKKKIRVVSTDIAAGRIEFAFA